MCSERGLNGPSRFTCVLGLVLFCCVFLGGVGWKWRLYPTRGKEYGIACGPEILQVNFCYACPRTLVECCRGGLEVPLDRPIKHCLQCDFVFLSILKFSFLVRIEKKAIRRWKRVQVDVRETTHTGEENVSQARVEFTGPGVSDDKRQCEALGFMDRRCVGQVERKLRPFAIDYARFVSYIGRAAIISTFSDRLKSHKDGNRRGIGPGPWPSP